MSKYLIYGVVLSVCLALVGCTTTSIRVVGGPDTGLKNDFYVGNRPPLMSSPFMKLPIGAIQPHGWLNRQLELERDGFTGNLLEISEFLKKENNAWLSPKGEGHSGWEELPYWLKGFGDLGYVLGDQQIIKEARQWLEAAIASQREDGYFGPRSNLTHTKGKTDLWPNMIMLNALQSYYEYTGDERVLKLMSRYFRWQMTIPDEDFLEPFWQNQRAGDNLASVYWLYNLTGEKWLLNLAEKIHRNTADWTGGVASWHGVNISQCFRGPAIFYQQSKDPKHLAATERNYDTVRGIYGQVPGGLYGADENCREGFVDPRQGAETCTMVEMMLSDEMLLKSTGEPKWADRCEDVAFNSLPASMTPDLKALRYLTAPNQILSDRNNKSPGVQNDGPMFLYDPYDHRCCQHNVAHGWPYYAEHLWLVTAGNGLAAVLYAPCRVTAKVGDGTEVTIVEETRYPFEETVRLTITTARPVQFPLYLRVPGWCENPEVSINNEKAVGFGVETTHCRFLEINRGWTNGDKLTLKLPAKVTITKWTENKDCVSVSRGPLTYSLKIGEKYVRAGGTDKWPAWEIHPTTAWNYGLVFDEKDLASSFEVVCKDWADDSQPFEADAAPIEMRAKAKKISGWQKDNLGLVGKLEQSPVKSDEPTETVTLIPMGCARLRISAFPTISESPDAHEWKQPSATLPAAASHCGQRDTVDALSDGLLPQSSNDQSIPRFTWWDHRGTTEWVQYDFKQPRKVASAQVYWFDDTGSGGCRVPKSWRVLYKDGDQWKDVTNVTGYDVAKDKFNQARFDPLQTASLRIEVQLQPEFSGGILEWRIDGENR
ncbi:MAG: glycoside hydrolase family 127 protein [Planctomycetota bacterium]|nr:glycoside hydrolase family 127 protein [Planctomycetota bacterium]